jgi:type III restriction enzyme
MWQGYRRQKLLFEVAARVIRGQTELATLFRQALAAVERFVETKVVYARGIDERELDNELYKSVIANQLLAAIRPAEIGDGKLLPVLDQYQPEGSTETVAFSTAKLVEPTTRSQVNYVVCDSELERQVAQELEADERVDAYVKNDHLFCEIPYRHEGRTLRYIPDFLVRLSGNRHLLIEGKGRERPKDQAKQTAAGRWVAAVNADGRWGTWSHAVVRHRSEVRPAVDAALPAST